MGVIEAPRGTLIHHYKINDEGLITWANLIVASGHNNLAMNRSVLQVAKHYVKGSKINEGMLNRVEAVIRTYDPCLSCSTHAAGRMPLLIEAYDKDGNLTSTLKTRLDVEVNTPAREGNPSRGFPFARIPSEMRAKRHARMSPLSARREYCRNRAFAMQHRY